MKPESLVVVLFVQLLNLGMHSHPKLFWKEMLCQKITRFMLRECGDQQLRRKGVWTTLEPLEGCIHL